MEDKDEILKGLDFIGYYDETEKYVIEIEKESAIKLLARIIVNELELGETTTQDLVHAIAEELQADKVIIN